MIWLLLIGLVLAFIVFMVIVGAILKAIFFLLGTLLLAGLASAAAQSFLKYRGNLTFTLVSGLAGGVVGIVLAKALNVPGVLQWPHIGGFPVLWTLVGAFIVVGVARVLQPRRDRRALR